MLHRNNFLALVVRLCEVRGLVSEAGPEAWRAVRGGPGGAWREAWRGPEAGPDRPTYTPMSFGVAYPEWGYPQMGYMPNGVGRMGEDGVIFFRAGRSKMVLIYRLISLTLQKNLEDSSRYSRKFFLFLGCRLPRFLCTDVVSTEGGHSQIRSRSSCLGRFHS